MTRCGSGWPWSSTGRPPTVRLASAPIIPLLGGMTPSDRSRCKAASCHNSCAHSRLPTPPPGAGGFGWLPARADRSGMAGDEFDDRVVRLDEHRTEPKPLDHFREAEKALAAARRELTRLKLHVELGRAGKSI